MRSDLLTAGERFDGLVSMLGGGARSYDDFIDAIAMIQDEVIEEPWNGTFVVAWPPCPGHAHPMSIEATDNWLLWCCPTTRVPITNLGDLKTMDPVQ